MSAEWGEYLRDAAEIRRAAALLERAAIEDLNAVVRAASEAGLSAIAIAEAIGTTRQRVYEILRG